MKYGSATACVDGVLVALAHVGVGAGKKGLPAAAAEGHALVLHHRLVVVVVAVIGRRALGIERIFFILSSRANRANASNIIPAN